jgi:hypothetical protein
MLCLRRGPGGRSPGTWEGVHAHIDEGETPVETAVRELIQGECRPDEIAAEVARLLADRAAASRRRERFTVMKGLLGPPGATERAATAIAGELAPTSAPAPPGAAREGD